MNELFLIVASFFCGLVFQYIFDFGILKYKIKHYEFLKQTLETQLSELEKVRGKK
jgi:hypothetical protein